MTQPEYLEILRLRPASKAIFKLVERLPYGLTPNRCVNELQTDLNLVYAWTLERGSRTCIAVSIDGGLGESFPRLIQCFARIGADASLQYAKAAEQVCGGAIPADEVERAELTETHTQALYLLDERFLPAAEQDAAAALLAFLEKNPAKSYGALLTRVRS